MKWNTLTDEQQDLIMDESSNWKESNDLFWRDYPTCLDDDLADVWENWLCNNFVEYVENGTFDEEINKLI